jgi:hypothetical protein
MPLSRRAAIAWSVIALGCSRPNEPRCAHDAAARADPGAAFRYRVAAGPRAEELCVEVDLPRGAAAEQRWAPEGPLRPFVRDVRMAGDGDFAPVRVDDGVWHVPACTAARGCRVRYRVLLAEAARRLDDADLALDHRGVLLAPPSSWLLRPLAVRAPFRLTVRAPPGGAFVTGLGRAEDGDFGGDVAALDDTPYAAFGPLAERTLGLPGGVLRIAFAPGDRAPEARAAVDAWIDGSARALAAYFGRFPAPEAALIVRLEDGAGIGDGHTMGNGGAAILLTVGERTAPADLASDWVLVHELVHLSFPDVRRPWAEEGLATYLEPIIRARAGLLDADEVWHQLVEGLPQGLPEPGDGGLDHTDTWGRRYWGGALFWLTADVEIRKRTGNRRSLDDVLRAVVAAGGNVAVRWDLDRVLALGDEAVGVEVLRPLRRSMGGAPVAVDLPALWQSLGISLHDGRVRYDDGAPLAAVRRGIAAPGGG